MYSDMLPFIRSGGVRILIKNRSELRKTLQPEILLVDLGPTKKIYPSRSPVINSKVGYQSPRSKQVTKPEYCNCDC